MVVRPKAKLLLTAGLLALWGANFSLLNLFPITLDFRRLMAFPKEGWISGFDKL
jgi:hypothetical protein